MKKFKILIKIVNIDGKNCSFLLDDSKNFNEIFKKDVTYAIIKSCNNQGHHPFSRRYSVEETSVNGV